MALLTGPSWKTALFSLPSISAKLMPFLLSATLSSSSLSCIPDLDLDDCRETDN